MTTTQEAAELVERLRDTGLHSPSLAADLIEAQSAEIGRLRAAIERQASAVRTLQYNEQTEINQLRKGRNDAYRAVATLDSEREMNALLTEEIEAQSTRIAELEAVIKAFNS